MEIFYFLERDVVFLGGRLLGKYFRINHDRNRKSRDVPVHDHDLAHGSLFWIT